MTKRKASKTKHAAPAHFTLPKRTKRGSLLHFAVEVLDVMEENGVEHRDRLHAVTVTDEGDGIFVELDNREAPRLPLRAFFRNFVLLIRKLGADLKFKNLKMTAVDETREISTELASVDERLQARIEAHLWEQHKEISHVKH